MSGRHRRASPPADRRRLAIIGGVVAALVAVAIAVPLAVASGGQDGRDTAAPTGTPTHAPTSAVSPGRSSAAVTTTAPPPVTGGATTAATTSASPRRPSRSSSPAPAAPPTLVVRADRGASWLVVRDARGRDRFNALLRRGDVKRFDGPFFSVVLGDAAQVEVVVNGKARPRGRPGQVERFTVRGS